MHHPSSHQQTRQKQSFKQQDSFKQISSQQPFPKQPRPERSSQPESLSDRDLLSRMRILVQKERELLTDILYHLKEVERRKLYSDLGYKSLFDYAVGELNYSEGQAGRRIQAMKLLRELPQNEQKAVEQKIASGALNLSNICQAQSFFNQLKKAAPEKSLNAEQKIAVLKDLEHKSARQGQVSLLQRAESAGTGPFLPKEKERLLSPEHTELRLVLSAEQLARLQEVRALMGPKALGMSWAELIEEMAALSLNALKDKKFGKRRDRKSSPASKTFTPTLIKSRVRKFEDGADRIGRSGHKPEPLFQKSGPLSHKPGPLSHKSLPKARSISKGKRYRVWERSGGACVKCGAKEGLQVDHVTPVARGGGCEEENLRLLCFNCNVREGIKDFGMERMKRTTG